MLFFAIGWTIVYTIPETCEIIISRMSVSHSIKQLIKRGVQYAAANFGPHKRTPSSPALVILMYHRVLPENDPRYLQEEPGMVVTPATLESNLREIERLFDVVSLAEWIKARENGEKLPAKACAITFDDGWADNYEFAYPILKKHEIPATIFLVSEMINTQREFWPERLARIATQISSEKPELWSSPDLEWLTRADTSFNFGSKAPSREQLSQLIATAKSLNDDDIHIRLDQIEKLLGLNNATTSAALLNWQQVQEMQASGLIEFGSHTCNHIRLNSGLAADVLRHEIGDCKTHIEQSIERPVSAFCFPNGDYSPEALSLVKSLYRTAVTTESGWNNATSDAHLLKRIGVHNDIASDKTAFLARLSGWI